MKLLKTLFLLGLCLLPPALGAWPNYYTLSTDNFEVYYRKGWATEAMNALQALEYSRPYVEELTGNRPARVPVLLEDMGNMVNGYASPIGKSMALFAYPPSQDELALGEDWWQIVGIHEYIHMAQMTKVSCEPALLRTLFGNILYPNLYQPMWMTEGITVYGESQLSEYGGRLNAGTYAAVINALAREGKLPSAGKACYYSYGNPLAHYYVYGSSFHQYLADKYGESRFSQLYSETGSSLQSYLNPIYSGLSLDAAYKKVYGKPTTALWADWKAEMKQRSKPLPRQNITRRGGRTDNLQYHAGNLYYTNYGVSKTGPGSGFSSHRLIRVSDPGGKARQEVLVQQGSDFPAGYQIHGDKLYYSRSEFKGGYSNNNMDGLGVITQIWEQKLEGGGRRKLYSGPARSFCKLDDGQILISEDDPTHQKSILLKLDPSTKSKKPLGNLDCLIGTIHQSRGRIFVTARRFGHNNSIYELNLASLQLTPLVDTPYLETVTGVQDGNLLFTAIYNGENGSYLYNTSSRQVSKFSGFSELRCAVQDGSGQNWFIAVNGEGQDVYADRLSLQPFNPPSGKSSRLPYSRLRGGEGKVLGKYEVKRGTYASNILHMLWPRFYRIPFIDSSTDTLDSLFTLDQLTLGIMMAGQDVVGDFPLWSAAVLYDMSKKEWGYELSLENHFFRPVKHSLEFSNLDGKTLISQQYVPLITRMNYGFTGLNPGFGFMAWGKENENYRKLLYPFLEASFAYKGVRLDTTTSLLYESKDGWLSSDRDRLGWKGQYNLRVKAPLSTELRSNLILARDPDANQDEVFPALRGYAKEWDAREGFMLANSWYAPLFKIRNGFWTPNIYVEDINLGLFYDLASPMGKEERGSISAYGAELIAEISAGYVLSFNLGLRFSQNKDGQSRWDLIFGL